jgi:hypothetical protein
MYKKEHAGRVITRFFFESCLKIKENLTWRNVVREAHPD